MDVKFLDGLDILIPNPDRFLVLHTSLLLRLNIPRTEGPFNNKKTCGPYSQHDMQIFGWFGYLNTESRPISGFTHIPTVETKYTKD